MSGYKTSFKQREHHQANIDQFFKTLKNCDTDEIARRSPVSIPEDPYMQFAEAIEHLFEPNAVVELKLAKMKEGKPKAAPCGQDFRLHAHEWVQLARSCALSSLLGSHCGVYMRVNPVKNTGPGNGARGVTTDADIAIFEHILIEHDWLKIKPQAQLLSALALPICAITESGGGSLHALVKVRAADAEQYAHEAKGLLTILYKHFGFDPTNNNPSRLTRAPGLMRREHDKPDQLQRLIYLNPNPTFKPICEF